MFFDHFYTSIRLFRNSLGLFAFGFFYRNLYFFVFSILYEQSLKITPPCLADQLSLSKCALKCFLDLSLIRVQNPAHMLLSPPPPNVGEQSSCSHPYRFFSSQPLPPCSCLPSASQLESNGSSSTASRYGV